MKARVLHVVGALSGGGIQTFLRNLVRHADRERFPMDVCVMAEDAGELAGEFEAEGCHVYHCPLRSAPLTYARRFGALLRSGEYQVVHAHRSSAMMAFPLRAAARSGVPVRVAHFQSIHRRELSVRGVLSPLLHRMLRAAATNVVGVSRAVLDTHFPANWEHDPRFVVIPNAIETAAYRVARAEAANRPFVVGHIARFTEAKNHDAIVEIAEQIVRERRDVRFVLAGEGPDRVRIEGLVRKKGLQDIVSFPGWSSDVAGLLATFDVFLFPSRWEGFPLALIEAQAAGLPCVTSDLVCFSEVLHPELWALRFPLSDLRKAAIGVEFLLDNPHERERLGMLASAHVEQFDIRHTVARIERIYEEGLR